MRMTPTNTDSNGTGYYRGENGEYYYGNPKNGYVSETHETEARRKARENPPQNNSQTSNFSNHHYNTGAPSYIETLLVAGASGIIMVVLLAATALFILFMMAQEWFSMYSSFATFASDYGIFPALHYRWDAIAFTIAAFYYIKKTFQDREIPWGSCIICFAVLSLLFTITIDFHAGLFSIIGDAIAGCVMRIIPFAILLYVLHFADSKIIRRY